MKTLKSLLSLFALVAVFSTGAFAQTIDVSATVLNQLTVETTTGGGQLSFGNFADNTVATQALTNGNVSNLGAIKVSGMSVSASIDFELTVPANLTADDEDFDDLPFAPVASLTTTENTPESPVTNGNYDFSGGKTTSTVTVDPSTAGPYYVYVGGTLDATGAGNYGGSYSGEITLSVSYN